MVWGSGISWIGIGLIHKIYGILDKEKYISILENEIYVLWPFQRGNVPKHMAKFTKKLFSNNSVYIFV